MGRTKALTKAEPETLFFNIELFEHAQRVSKMFATSTMVPDHFKQNIGNCLIALNYAHRTGIDCFMAMQQIYIIHGKPSTSAQLQIALFNKSKAFSSLKFDINKEKTTCTAYATEKATGEKIIGPEVTIEMAKKEGWYSKKGSKWVTLPELMLRYRAAAFFIRLYAPETTLGLYTSEEMQDVIDVTPVKMDIQEQIEQEANTEILDIQVEPEPDPEPEQNNGPEMTDEEKQDAVISEIAEGEPGF